MRDRGPNPYRYANGRCVDCGVSFSLRTSLALDDASMGALVLMAAAFADWQGTESTRLRCPSCQGKRSAQSAGKAQRDT